MTINSMSVEVAAVDRGVGVIEEGIRHYLSGNSLMGAQAAGKAHRRGHYDVYQRGQSFDDVTKWSSNSSTGTPRRPTECSFGPTDQPPYVPKRAIAARNLQMR
jgi:hypothetical protein